MIELKLNWLRFWYHMPATSLQSKCNMICDKFAWIRRGKILVFKSKALSFYTTLLCMFLLYGREWYCCESFTLNSMCQCLGKRGSHNITFSASLHIKQLYSFYKYSWLPALRTLIWFTWKWIWIVFQQWSKIDSWRCICVGNLLELRQSRS